MKKILLTGYYGFDNLGDEAVLESIIREIKEHIKDSEITVLSNNPEKTTAIYQVKAVNRWKLGQTLAAIRNSDILVLGGGSLLQDVTGTRSLSFYLMQIKLAHFFRRPVFLYAQGIGPVNEAKNQHKMAKALKKATLITVRDQESADFLLALGLAKEKIIVTVDPVLAAPPQASSAPSVTEKSLGIALRPWQDLDEQRLSVIATCADHFAAQGYNIVLLPFHEPDDREISEKLQAKMHHQPYLAPEKFGFKSMLDTIAPLNLVLGMRLHSLIMAASMTTPLVGLSYDPKVESFCRSIEQPVIAVSDIESDLLIAKVEQVLKEQALIRSLLEQRKSAWTKISKANALLLADVLENRPPNSVDELIKIEK